MKILKNLNTIFPKESCGLYTFGIRVYITNDDPNAFCNVITNIFQVENLRYKENECMNFYVFYDKQRDKYTRTGGTFCFIRNIPLMYKSAVAVKHFKASQFLDISKELGRSMNR